MSLPTLSFAEFQSLFFTQYSAVANTPANTNQGSTLWAIGNAAALLALNVQNELEYVLAISRLSTSISTIPGVNSPNVDSFVNPFGIYRIEATFASGGVTFTAPSVATVQIVVPVGGQVSTTSGILYTVIADPTNAAYSSVLNGYPINVGSTTVIGTVQSSVGGTAGNAQPGQINTLANSLTVPPITGIGTVSNVLAFINGENAEADTALATRFQTTMSTGIVATDNALVAALLGVYPGTTPGVPGLTYSCGDGLNSSGSATAATVSFYVNYYGTGTAPPSSLITAVENALIAVKAGGVTVNAYAPTLVPVNIAATIHIPVGQTIATVLTACANAYNAYLNTIGLNPSGGSTVVDYFAIAAVLLGVTNVTKIDSLLIGENSFTAVMGTSTATGTTSLTDSTQSWTVNAYVGDTVTSGSSFGVITANTATAVTVTAWTNGTPVVGANYTISSTPASTADITATFGNQLVAGTVSFTAAQP